MRTRNCLFFCFLIFAQLLWGQVSPWSVDLSSQWRFSHKTDKLQIIGSNNDPLIFFTYITEPQELERYHYLQLGINYQLNKDWQLQTGLGREEFLLSFDQLAISRGVNNSTTQEANYSLWQIPLGFQYRVNSFLNLGIGARFSVAKEQTATSELIGFTGRSKIVESDFIPYTDLELAIPPSNTSHFQFFTRLRLQYREAWFQGRRWGTHFGAGLRYVKTRTQKDNDSPIRLSLHTGLNIGLITANDIFLTEETDPNFFGGFIRIRNSVLGPIWKWGLTANYAPSDKWELYLGSNYVSQTWELDYEHNMIDVIGFEPRSRFNLYHWEFPLGLRYRWTDQFDIALQNAIRIFNIRQAWPLESDPSHFEDSMISPALELGYRTPIGQSYDLRLALTGQLIRQNLAATDPIYFGSFGLNAAIFL